MQEEWIDMEKWLCADNKVTNMWCVRKAYVSEHGLKRLAERMGNIMNAMRGRIRISKARLNGTRASDETTRESRLLCSLSSIASVLPPGQGRQ